LHYTIRLLLNRRIYTMRLKVYTIRGIRYWQKAPGYWVTVDPLTGEDTVIKKYPNEGGWYVYSKGDPGAFPLAFKRIAQALEAHRKYLDTSSVPIFVPTDSSREEFMSLDKRFTISRKRAPGFDHHRSRYHKGFTLRDKSQRVFGFETYAEAMRCVMRIIIVNPTHLKQHPDFQYPLTPTTFAQLNDLIPLSLPSLPMGDAPYDPRSPTSAHNFPS
jgi:hypothetical protein